MNLLKFNQNGNALIQVIVASAIMAVLLAATASMISQQTASIGFLEDSLSRTTLETELTSVFSNSTSCTQNLSGALLNTPTAQSAFTLTDSTGQVLYNPSSGQNGKFNQLQISASVKNTSVTGPSSTGNAIITVNVSRIRSGGGPQVLKPITFNTQVAVDNTSKVVSCGGAGSMGGCLDYAGGLTQGASNPFSPVTRQVVVPPNAKAMTINFSFGTRTAVTGRGGTGNTTTGTCAWPSDSLTVYFGTTRLGGQVLQPGRVLTVTNFSNGNEQWTYGGQVLAFGVRSCLISGAFGMGTGMGSPYSWTKNVPWANLGAVCPTVPVPTPPTYGLPVTGSNTAGFALFWK